MKIALRKIPFFRKYTILKKLRTYGEKSFKQSEMPSFMKYPKSKKIRMVLDETKELDSLLQGYRKASNYSGSQQKLKDNIIADGLTFFAQKKKEQSLARKRAEEEEEEAFYAIDSSADEEAKSNASASASLGSRILWRNPAKPKNGLGLAFASIALALVFSVTLLYAKARFSMDSGVVFHQDALQQDINFMIDMEGGFFVGLE